MPITINLTATAPAGAGRARSRAPLVWCSRGLVATCALLCALLFASPARAGCGNLANDINEATVSVNFPPFECTGSAGPGRGCFTATSDIITYYSISADKAWARVVNASLEPVDAVSNHLIFGVVFDGHGVAPGNYAVNVSIPITSYSTGSDSNGHPCALTEAFVTVITYFITVNGNTEVLFVDPAPLYTTPGLMSGNTVLTSDKLGLPQNLTLGRTVGGIAADGIAEIVVRISTTAPNEQFQLTLINDVGGTSNNPNEDGALGTPGASTFSANQLNVVSTNAPPGQLAYAFAIYRAPLDFARPSGSSYKSGGCGGTPTTDNLSNCRTVSIRVQDVTTNTTVGTFPIIVIRPLVVLIHGLWSAPTDWDNFYPLVTGSDPTQVDGRFSLIRARYDETIGSQITSSQPSYPSTANAKRNALGVEYNASYVLAQVGNNLRFFRSGTNRLGFNVAAAQVDVVGHSMGGLIARAMALNATTFLTAETFGQGYIHKLISIDTPHLGSPVATQILGPNENGCLQRLLADHDSFAFQTVTLAGTPINGAVADLMDSPSQILSKLATQNPHPLPASMIAGIYSNFASLDQLTGPAVKIRTWPKVGCRSDPLAQELTASEWPKIFNQQPNDGIVAETSQLNNLIPSPGSQFPNSLHSQGMTKLGFAPPTVMDAGPVPTQTIFLLNIPYNNSIYYNNINP